MKNTINFLFGALLSVMIAACAMILNPNVNPLLVAVGFFLVREIYFRTRGEKIFGALFACGDLIQSLVLDCTNIMQGGVGGGSRLILILKEDVSSFTATGVDIISAITLAANKSAYSFDGVKQSLKPKFERVQAASGQSLYKHTAEFYFFDYSQIGKNNLTRLGNGRYIAIYENAKQDANTFEVLGIDAGLEVVEMMRAPQENGGAVKVVLASAENEFETKPPRTFYDATSYASTKGILEGYLYLPTITASGLSIVTYPAVTPTAIVITGTNFFAGGVNNGVLKVELVNNATGSVIPWVAALTVTNTTITTSAPATGEGSGKSYKVRVTTIKGVVLSSQNIITT